MYTIDNCSTTLRQLQLLPSLENTQQRSLQKNDQIISRIATDSLSFFDINIESDLKSHLGFTVLLALLQTKTKFLPMSLARVRSSFSKYFFATVKDLILHSLTEYIDVKLEKKLTYWKYENIQDFIEIDWILKESLQTYKKIFEKILSQRPKSFVNSEKIFSERLFSDSVLHTSAFKEFTLKEIQVTFCQYKQLFIKDSITDLDKKDKCLAVHLNHLYLKHIPSEIFLLTHLKVLILNDNQLEVLPDSIFHLHNLKRLDLSMNLLSILPRDISQLSRLENLNLTRNQLKCLPENICSLTNLKELYLTQNRLKKLPCDLLLLTKLKILHIKNNPFISLPDGLKKLHLDWHSRNHLRKMKAIVEGTSRIKKISSDAIVEPDFLFGLENLFSQDIIRPTINSSPYPPINVPTSELSHSTDMSLLQFPFICVGIPIKMPRLFIPGTIVTSVVSIPSVTEKLD